MIAIVINCSRNGLGVIRSLGVEGVQVVALDHYKYAPGLHSKYVIRKHVVSWIDDDEEKFIDQVLQIGREEFKRNNENKIPLFPVNDIYVLTFCKYWDRLKQFFIPVFELNYDVLMQCVDKNKTAKLASKVGVPIPKTYYGPLSRIYLEKLKYPVIIKPDLRNSVENVNKKVFRLKECKSDKDLRKYAYVLEGKSVSYVVQEYIKGGDDSLYTAGIFSYKGRILAAFTGRKIRQFPPVYGECSYGESVDGAGAIIKNSEILMSATGFTGIAQIEYKKYNNEYYLLEINPRSWSWISLPTYVGVNLPWIAYKAVSGEKAKAIITQKKHGTWMYFLNDLRYNVIGKKNVGFLPFLRCNLKANCHAHYQKNDIKPFYYYLLSMVYFKLPKYFGSSGKSVGRM